MNDFTHNVISDYNYQQPTSISDIPDNNYHQQPMHNNNNTIMNDHNHIYYNNPPPPPPPPTPNYQQSVSNNAISDQQPASNNLSQSNINITIPTTSFSKFVGFKIIIMPVTTKSDIQQSPNNFSSNIIRDNLQTQSHSE
jgi:hypothetical protein